MPLTDPSHVTEVVTLVERIFRDIAAKKPLTDFAVANQITAGNGGAYAEAFVLRPALWAVGVDLKELPKHGKQNVYNKRLPCDRSCGGAASGLGAPGSGWTYSRSRGSLTPTSCISILRHACAS
jgi:hypothetical protein